MNWIGIILAAGEGTRMKSSVPKVLHHILGKPILDYVIDLFPKMLIRKIFIVTGKDSGDVCNRYGSSHGVAFVGQPSPRGTGDAVKQVFQRLKGYSGNVLILCGDTPLIKKETIRKLVRMHTKKRFAATLVSTQMPDPSGYGRIIRDPKTSAIRAIVEEKEASPSEKKIKEINSGIYCFRSDYLSKALPLLKRSARKKEYYLTDVISIISGMGGSVGSLEETDQGSVSGINTRGELLAAGYHMRDRILAGLMASGVTIIDKHSTMIGKDVRIGKDTVIFPNTIITGDTKIGSFCSIGPFSFLKDCAAGDRVQIRASFIDDSHIGHGAIIGPYAHLRPGTRIAREAKIGNFCEVKKSDIGEKTKISHLSYVGDSSVGRRVNIGAGVITCNYDGVDKKRTVIRDGVFVGSDVQFIAPVNIGKGAYIAAGSTITDDVSAGQLAIARSRQINKDRKKGKR